LHSVECEYLNSKYCEGIWCKKIIDKVNYVIDGVCYRSQVADEQEISQFDCINSACNMNHPIQYNG